MSTVEKEFILKVASLWKIWQDILLGRHFLKERMNYVREESMVIYKSKDGKNIRQFDETDFIASLASHIPNKGEQMVRYLGFYSNVCRGRRKGKRKMNWTTVLLPITNI